MFSYLKKVIYNKLDKSIKEKATLLSDEKLSEKIDFCYEREEFFNDKRAKEIKYIYLQEFYRRKLLKDNREQLVKFS